MKKFVVAILAVCLVFAGFVGYMNRDISAQEPAESQAPAAESAEPVESEKLDYEAMFALHEPEEVVLTADGKDITWDEYFSWVYMSAMQTEQYFFAMANYGVPMKWSDPVGEDAELSYADAAITGAENTLRQLLTIEGYAQAQGIEASPETLEAIEQQRSSDMLATVGEEGTEEDFAEYLKSLYRSESAYSRSNYANFINIQHFVSSYGEQGEKVGDEQALAYLEENGYLRANHILLSTIDLQTGEPLEEAQVEEKKALAEKLAAELQAIEEPEQLSQRFLALKEEYCEDTGKTAYPEGYVFQPGQMVAEFEEGSRALEAYGVSQPIETSYGYHIILRLPLDADAVVSYDSAGSPLTARMLYANFDYAAGLDKYLEGVKLEYAQGFEPVDLTKYIK